MSFVFAAPYHVERQRPRRVERRRAVPSMIQD